jgi:SAM-dependent methyltransferase
MARSAPTGSRQGDQGADMMNRLHQWICSSTLWSRHAQRTLVPWVLDSVTLGETVLEIGPGYGVTTRVLASRLTRVTALEADADLAERLRSRVAGVSTVHGDGAAMPFDAESYSGVVCFTMLHHVPSQQLQERLFAEAHRVLQPGGVFAGTDSRDSVPFRLIHLADTLVVVDPNTLASRLSTAGFEEIDVDKRRGSFRFSARKPALHAAAP